MNIEKRLFGRTQDGAEVALYTLISDSDIQVSILDYGGTIVSLLAPDRDGQLDDIVLGFDNLEDYLTKSPFFGCVAGRFANRIAKATFELGGVTYQLAQNDGENHLHGGVVGFDKVVWAAESVTTTTEASLVLTHLSPDGDEGYPGNLSVRVVYTLNRDGELRIDYNANTDKATVLNLTNHSYFNLAGRGDILDHRMTLHADSFTPIDGTLIPIGVLRDVTGTPMDFRQARRIGDRIDDDDDQLRFGGGYDHNWVVRGQAGQLRLAARVDEATTGRFLEVETTQPGIQFYAGNMMPDLVGRSGRAYSRRTGLCLETQHFPDSPNQPSFPSVVLEPGQEYSETTVFRFGAGD